MFCYFFLYQEFHIRRLIKNCDNNKYKYFFNHFLLITVYVCKHDISNTYIEWDSMLIKYGQDNDTLNRCINMLVILILFYTFF